MKIALPPPFPCKCSHVAAGVVFFSSTLLNLVGVHTQRELTHSVPGENDAFEADIHTSHHKHN